MRRAKRSALVPHTPLEMYRLVDEVERYPEFLPWCRSTTLHFRDETRTEASIEVQRGGIRKTFSTQNANVPGESIHLKLLDGPFRELSGDWTFEAVADYGCRVSLDIGFEFENRVLDVLLGRFFEDTLNSLVDAFTARAQVVYGAPGDADRS